MKRMMFLGALVLGVTVCSQSFGFELLNKMLGHKGCTSCCEPGCDAGAGCCEPGCDAGAGNGCCEPACGAGNGCSEPACGAGNGCCEPSCGAASCCGTRKAHRHVLRDLIAALKAKHARKSCCGTGCCGGEPDCSAGNGCCEPACGADPACGAGCATAAEPTPDASASVKAVRTIASK